MALPVLDGNQTATTLSSVVTGGEHIVAHSVVSLGTIAISNITSAVSGSVVSISNFPTTQTIAGTVTANGSGTFVDSNSVTVSGFMTAGGWDSSNSQHAPIPLNDGGTGVRVAYDDQSGISFPISGTVTANVFGKDPNSGVLLQIPINESSGAVFVEPSGSGEMFPVSGTVTVGNTVTVAGTVTANASNGSLTTRFGSVTTANTSFATSAVTNANRKYLLIQNVTTGSNVITVGIGFTPTTTQGIQLTAGAGITFESSYIPTGAVLVLSSVTASNFTILEA